jgi:hypothetical protein
MTLRVSGSVALSDYAYVKSIEAIAQRDKGEVVETPEIGGIALQSVPTRRLGHRVGSA